ncbi:type I-C CRISPR-associated endonuclease Cas1c [Ferruginivarius sediminum]|uniref:CRISPR-associated endonuclease Cas1 n=1 Tax=Ferruginivarius sediminum TaxID=2661937 RepID=A0A369T8M0_9PROT|nr:type I-C CRISPR-associated endonuclease Cas1c [Ferruginivarius sediminum]RDD61242.1 type I-C CRISPR-associated endonuclease Cas1 [Ferruginivarius sediminum]
MKRHLNTLFVTTPGTYLAKDGECVQVRVEGENKTRIPILALDGVVCFGQVSYSPYLLAHCAENGVTVTHLSENGRFLARIQGPTSGNVLLRRMQYRWADDPGQSAALARVFVLAKLHNARIVYQRGQREAGEGERKTALAAGADRLAGLIGRVETAADLDAVRGVEGEGAMTYWRDFQALVTRGGDGFVFDGRTRRPPLDRVNCLLSFLYTVLAHDIRSALETAGLDPYVGYLHRDRPGRASLALDMMEEFRPWLVDRLVLSLINRGQVTAGGFTREDTGGYLMDDDTRRQVLTAWQERKQDVVTHPFLNEKMPIGLLWHTQALLLARHLRGDLDGYPPVLWR